VSGKLNSVGDQYSVNTMENLIGTLTKLEADLLSTDLKNSAANIDETGNVGIVLVHGLGGGVFSWRHVMGVLARQVGCEVVAFDRPGWGLTSPSRKNDWEENQLPNPYKLETQVDLLLSFCLEMGFSSVVLIGHDDGARELEIPSMGIVLIGVSLSREVVLAFARILLRTSLGKKHLVSLTILQGPVLAEVHQRINPWIRQITRVYKGKEHVEVEFAIKPIPVDDGRGKEVATLILTTMKTNKMFYTDYNG
ncbi:hypothetical protein GIB67_004624, partial [Kingdonia uniflora]